MSSIPTPPASPSTRRRSVRLSSYEVSQDTSPSPYTSGFTNDTTFSQRSSRTSQTSFGQSPSPTVVQRTSSVKSSRPSSVYRQYSHHRKSSGRLSIGSNFSFEFGNGNDNNGLGNLADELEDALGGGDDDDDGGPDGYEMDASEFLAEMREGGDVVSSSPMQGDSYNDGIVDEAAAQWPPSPYSQTARLADHDLDAMVLRASSTHSRSNSDIVNGGGTSVERSGRTHLSFNGHQHQKPNAGSEGYDNDNPDNDSISPTLRKRLKVIEDLVRVSTINAEDTLSETGVGIIQRMTQSLKDLGPPQTTIESNLSRIISANTAMTNHRTTQKTRDLFNHTKSLFYGPQVYPLNEQDIDTLLSELDILSSTISPTIPLNHNHHNHNHHHHHYSHSYEITTSLQHLFTQTLDLIHTLRHLTDTLQEFRVQHALASRKLRSVREMIEDIRVEQDLVETSMLLIQAGDWDRRCRERQAARTCREVVRGFGVTWGVEVGDDGGSGSDEKGGEGRGLPGGG